MVLERECVWKGKDEEERRGKWLVEGCKHLLLRGWSADERQMKVSEPQSKKRRKVFMGCNICECRNLFVWSFESENKEFDE